MLLFLTKFKGTIFCVIIALIGSALLMAWVDNQKTRAIDDYKLRLEVATNKQVSQDVKSIHNTFSNPTDAMRSRADKWVQQSDETAGSKLSSTQVDTATTTAEGGGGQTVNLCGQCLLLDSEINYIRKHADLLQGRE